jgi:uncharacterized protein YjiS (DUF1127 family)
MTRFCENGIHLADRGDAALRSDGKRGAGYDHRRLEAGPDASKSWSARLLNGSVLVISQMWHAYWQWRGRQAMLMFLHSLDERTLKDFGVTREEMNSFLDKQFARSRCQRTKRRCGSQRGVRWNAARLERGERRAPGIQDAARRI